MNTKSIARGAVAAVTGARHLRIGRNGQDAAARWLGPRAAAVIVCDGCGSAPASEVGAQLGARLWMRAFARVFHESDTASDSVSVAASIADPALWARMRARVVRELAAIAATLGGELADAVHDFLLFTCVIAAADDTGAACVYAIGDGAFAFGGGRPRALGPFADNAPPYLAYDLLGHPPVPATFTLAPPSTQTIVIATDGADRTRLAELAAPRFVDHADALRRHLTVLARDTERIDWDARRIARTPAALQDDCAVGILGWELA
jgi:hypothetical protein